MSVDKAALRLSLSLGLTQTIGYASSAYLPAVLARPIADTLGIAVSTVYAAYSMSLMVSTFTAPVAGRCVDRWGGKYVLVASNVWFALSLLLMSRAQNGIGLFLSWASMGLAMGSGLYDITFASVIRSRGQAAQIVIIGITLIAGFASTVGWPISHYFLVNHGWRYALLAWAGAHIFVSLPLHLSLLLPVQPQRKSAQTEDDAPHVQNTSMFQAMAALSLAFVFSSFSAGAMAGHIPSLLQLAGVGVAASMMISSTIGIAQVAARLIHLFVLKNMKPINTGILAVLVMPLGTITLLLFGPQAAFLVGATHGFGNGMMSIIKAMLPLSLFGEKGFGFRQGLLFMPAGIMGALSSFLFSLCIEAWGRASLYIYVAALWSSALLFLTLRHLTKEAAIQA